MIDHSDATIVLAEDQEQVDKVLEIKERLPKVHRIIYDDPKGLRHYTDPLLISFQDVQERGRQLGQEHPQHFDALVAAGQATDVALIAYTSGTTGTPKGAMLSQANLIAAVEGFLTIEQYHPSDETLAYLPPAWVGDTFWSLAGSLIAGFTVNCPEGPATVQDNIREIAPHFLVAPPRIWENLVSQVQVKMADASFIKRLALQRIHASGIRRGAAQMEKKPRAHQVAVPPRAWRVLCVCSPARPLGLPAHPFRLHGWGAARAGDLFVFSRPGDQSQTGVRTDRNFWCLVRAAGWRCRALARWARLSPMSKSS